MPRFQPLEQLRQEDYLIVQFKTSLSHILSAFKKSHFFEIAK
jgi:hypothetical protein